MRYLGRQLYPKWALRTGRGWRTQYLSYWPKDVGWKLRNRLAFLTVVDEPRLRNGELPNGSGIGHWGLAFLTVVDEPRLRNGELPNGSGIGHWGRQTRVDMIQREVRRQLHTVLWFSWRDGVKPVIKPTTE